MRKLSCLKCHLGESGLDLISRVKKALIFVISNGSLWFKMNQLINHLLRSNLHILQIFMIQLSH